jgi:hypothetical protein
MFLLAALDNAYRHAARAADAFLTSLSPLTYERGDYSDGTEKLDPDYEPAEGSSLTLGLEQFARGERVSSDWLFEDGCDGKCAHDECVCPHDHAAGVEASTPPAAFKLPMFDASDLEAIAARYLVGHFPWPEDGLFACTCGTKGFTIAAWSAHVGELQISETVFELQSLVYDQTQKEQEN